MSTKRLYIVIIVMLVLLNIFSFFINYSKSNDVSKGGPRNIIIERLSLDGKQIENYDVLISDHRKSLKSLRKEIYKLRQSYFLNSDSMLLVPLTNSYIELEKINKEHIDDLIEICTDSQRMEFKDFIKEQNLFSPNMNKKQ
jgi:protein CpxP